MTYGLPHAGLNLAFPFHFAFDRKMKLVQVGPRLSSIDPEWQPGANVRDRFALDRPGIPLDFDAICEHTGLVFMLECKESNGLVLRGQMTHDSERDVLVFLGGPWVTDIETLVSHDLALTDLAVHDALGDLLVMLKAKDVALADAQMLSKRLTKSETRFRELIRASSDVIAVLYSSGEVAYISPAIEGLLGRPAKEIVGRALREWIHQDDATDFDWLLSDLLEEPEGTRHMQLRLQGSGEKWHTVDVTLRNAIENPHIAGIVVNARDITNALELRRQLLQAQKMDLLGQLAGGIAHDFNNLLYVISSYASLMQEDIDPESSQHVDLEEILKATSQASTLTQQILAFSRKRVMLPSIVSLEDVVGNIDRMLRRLVGEHISLESIVDPSIAPVEVEVAQIEQAVINLVLNARDAMPEGGSIAIHVRNETIGSALVDGMGTTLDPGRYVVCEVSDTGIGMDEETLAHAFEPFFTTKGHGKGTGLGLSTVYSVISQHNGGVLIKSKKGEGTCVGFMLPACETMSVIRQTSIASEELRGGKERILAVDDQPTVLAIMKRTLESFGYAVVTESDPREALERAREEAFDLIISDILMPEMNGAELMGQIKAFRPEAKFLLVSGYAEDAWLKEHDLDELVILPKPFTKEVLAAWVRQILDDEEPEKRA